MMRRIVWVEREGLQGFRCSQCGWVFVSSGALVVKTTDEMKKEYEGQLNKEFAAHDCSVHTPPKK
jgi:hypothetical protein